MQFTACGDVLLGNTPSSNMLNVVKQESMRVGVSCIAFLQHVHFKMSRMF